MIITLNLPDDLAAQPAARPDADEFIGAAVTEALQAEKTGRSTGHANGSAPVAPARQDSANEEYWDRQNARRVSLIRKRHREGLTGEEQNELDGLQAEMSTHINAVHPLPFDALEELERYVGEAERRLSGES